MHHAILAALVVATPAHSARLGTVSQLACDDVLLPPCAPGDICPTAFDLDGDTLLESKFCYEPSETGPATHAAHTLTVFKPAGSSPPPVILYSGAGAFLESEPLSSLSPATHPELLALFQAGWCIVTYGAVGVNSAVPQSFPNVFYDYGTPEWEDFNLFWGEKDVVWARQWLADHAAALGVDNRVVVPWGTSTGGLYGASIALGEKRSFVTASSCQSMQDTRCAGLVGLAVPGWFPAFCLEESPAAHWLDATTLQPAARLADVDPALLVAASVSTWVRATKSYARSTPAFIAVEEPFGSGEFGRDPQTGQPAVIGEIALYLDADQDASTVTDWISLLHSSWFGVSLLDDLVNYTGEPGFHSSRSRLVVRDSVDQSVYASVQCDDPTAWQSLPLGSLPVPVSDTFSGGILNPVSGPGDLFSRIEPWLEMWLQPGAGGVPELVGPAVATRTGSCKNPVVYTSLEVPVLGESWTVEVGSAAGLRLLLSGAPSVPLDVPPFGELLVLNPLFFPPLSAPPLAGPAVALAIPSQPALAGLSIYSQALVGSPPSQLTNALDVILGL